MLTLITILNFLLLVRIIILFLIFLFFQIQFLISNDLINPSVIKQVILSESSDLPKDDKDLNIEKIIDLTIKEFPVTEQTYFLSNLTLFTKLNLVLIFLLLVYLSGLILYFKILGTHSFLKDSAEIIISNNQQIITNMKLEIIELLNQSSKSSEIVMIDSFLKLLETNNNVTTNFPLDFTLSSFKNTVYDLNSINETYRLLGLKDYKDFLYSASDNYWRLISEIDPMNYESRRFSSTILHQLAEEHSDTFTKFRSIVLQDIINTNITLLTELKPETFPLTSEVCIKLSLPIWLCLIGLFLINSGVNITPYVLN